MLPITCEEIVSNVERPRLFRSHSLSVVEKRIVSTDLILSPFTKEAWSMHFSRLTCVCVFVSSIVLFVTYRFSYDRISRMGGRTSAYPVPRKSAPLSSMLFLFRPLSVKETRKPAFVRQTASGMCCFLHAAVYDRFAASNYFWMKIPLSSKLLVYSDSWMIRKGCFLESLVVIFVVDVL